MGLMMPVMVDCQQNKQGGITMVLDDWQRIEKVVRWAGLSVNAFALHIGLHRGENLYQIKRGNNGISKELAELIVARYPEISRAWLVTGEGEMFAGGTAVRSMIPVYDTDVICLAQMERLPQPAGQIVLPRAGAVSFAAPLLNRTMEPDLPNGALLLLAAVEPADLLPGYAYLVVTDRMAVVWRVLRAEEDPEQLRLVAANPTYGEVRIGEYEIRALYRVKGYVWYEL